MSKTPIIELTEIAQAASSGYESFNESFRALDALVQLAVIDKDLTTPPVAPIQGDRYIVPAGATGAWAGWERAVAFYTLTGWQFRRPRIGWLAWVSDEQQLYSYSGTTWTPTLASNAGAGIVITPSASGNVFALDVMSMPVLTAPDPTADFVPIYDASASEHRRVSAGLLGSFMRGGSWGNSGGAIDDEVAQDIVIYFTRNTVIKSWALIGAPAGSCSIDVRKKASNLLPAVIGDSIVNGNYPALSSGTFASGTDLSGWSTVTVEAGYTLTLALLSSSVCSQVTLQLHMAMG